MVDATEDYPPLWLIRNIKRFVVRGEQADVSDSASLWESVEEGGRESGVAWAHRSKEIGNS